MLKCREVTRWLTLEPEQSLSPFRRVSVVLHLALCSHCRRHRQQLAQIRQLLDQASAAELEQSAHSLTADARERIAAQLSEQSKK